MQGISLDLTPAQVTGGVRSVSFYLDGAADAFTSQTFAPYQTMLGTADLALETHTVRAVAIGVTVNIALNAPPTAQIPSPATGAQYERGDTVPVHVILTGAGITPPSFCRPYGTHRQAPGQIGAQPIEIRWSDCQIISHYPLFHGISHQLDRTLFLVSSVRTSRNPT